MICPSCGTHVRDGLLRCPACHADLATTFMMPRITERWCASCGVQIPAGASSCPNCGTPVETAAPGTRRMEPAAAEALEADEHDDLDESFDAGSTRSMARIESAVPDFHDDPREDDAPPRSRATLLAAFAAILVVGGTVLYITHPWDPAAYSTKATEPADTSMAGFPGSVDSLSQDSAAQASGMTGDEYTYLLLSTAHANLLDIESRLAASEESLRTTGISGTKDDREAGLDTQSSLAVELSNLIASLDGVDVTSGTYAEDVDNLRTLGNWLRNWSDTLSAAWGASAALDDVAEREDEILSPLYAQANSDTTNAYKALFDQYIDDWMPQASAGE